MGNGKCEERKAKSEKRKVRSEERKGVLSEERQKKHCTIYDIRFRCTKYEMKRLIRTKYEMKRLIRTKSEEGKE